CRYFDHVAERLPVFADDPNRLRTAGVLLPIPELPAGIGAPAPQTFVAQNGAGMSVSDIERRDASERRGAGPCQSVARLFLIAPCRGTRGIGGATVTGCFANPRQIPRLTIGIGSAPKYPRIRASAGESCGEYKTHQKPHSRSISLSGGLSRRLAPRNGSTLAQL